MVDPGKLAYAKVLLSGNKAKKVAPRLKLNAWLERRLSAMQNDQARRLTASDALVK